MRLQREVRTVATAIAAAALIGLLTACSVTTPPGGGASANSESAAAASKLVGKWELAGGFSAADVPAGYKETIALEPGGRTNFLSATHLWKNRGSGQYELSTYSNKDAILVEGDSLKVQRDADNYYEYRRTSGAGGKDPILGTWALVGHYWTPKANMPFLARSIELSADGRCVLGGSVSLRWRISEKNRLAIDDSGTNRVWAYELASDGTLRLPAYTLIQSEDLTIFKRASQ